MVAKEPVISAVVTKEMLMLKLRGLIAMITNTRLTMSYKHMFAQRLKNTASKRLFIEKYEHAEQLPKEKRFINK